MYQTSELTVSALENVHHNDGIAIQNIVLATDFSEASLATLPYVRAISCHYDAEVHVVHVVGSGVFPLLPPPEQEKALTEANQMMRAFLQPSLGGCPQWKHRVESGEHSEVLLRLGKELGADLVVLGTNGRKGIKRFMLGSVAEEIFRLVPCPVLTVGPNARGKMPKEMRLQHILFPTSLERSSLEAFSCAVRLAQEYAAPLTVLHVARSNRRAKAAQARLEALLFSEKNAQLELLVAVGQPAPVIRKTAEAKQSDLIVLGVRSGGTWDRAATHAPGPVAYNVVAQAPCPVLTVRSQEVLEESAS